jgi:hypothetical protein
MHAAKRRLIGTVCAFVATALFVNGVSIAHAIDRCKVKVDKRTGVILVDATGVGGPLLWGDASGSEVNSFFNGATCVVADNAKRCQLADPLSLSSKTAPAGCTLYLDDGVAACSAWISGCSPGARSDRGAVVKDSNGLTLGTALDPSGQSAVRVESGTTVRLPISFDGTGFFSYGGLLYTSTDCSGLVQLPEDQGMVKEVRVLGNIGYYEPSSTSLQSVQSSLQFYGSALSNQTDCDNNFGPGNSTFVAPNACCWTAAFGMQEVGAAQTIPLGAYTPPFHIEVQ